MEDIGLVTLVRVVIRLRHRELARELDIEKLKCLYRIDVIKVE